MVDLAKFFCSMAERKNTPIELEEDERIKAPKSAPAQARERASVREKWEKNKRLYIGILLGALLLVGGIAYYVAEERENEKVALDNAEMAFRNFYRDSLDKAVNGASNFSGLKKIATEYEGTRAGNMANYMLGATLLQQGKVAEGRAHLEAYDKSKDLMLNVTALRGLAYSYEEEGKYAEAAAHYLQAAEKLENNQTTPLSLLDAGRCYQLAKDSEGATKAYKRLLKAYPNSAQAQDAQKYLARIAE